MIVRVHTATELQAAVSSSNATRITLAGNKPFVFNSSSTAVESIAGPTSLWVSRDLVLEAEPGHQAVIDADARYGDKRRVITVSGAKLTLRRINITGGYSIRWGGGARVEGDAELRLESSHVYGCTVEQIGGNAGGGGIAVWGNLSAYRSTISANRAWSDTDPDHQASGGGLVIQSNENGAGRAQLIESAVVGNSIKATGAVDGGGVQNWGIFEALRSEISFNTATSLEGHSQGAGIANARGAHANISGCTIQGNNATSDASDAFGGGVFNLELLFESDTPIGSLELRDVELSGNSVFSKRGRSWGGGMYHTGPMNNAFSGASAILYGALLMGNVASGPKAHVLPAPRGRHLPGVVLCERIECFNHSCNTCNLDDYPQLEGQSIAHVLPGPIDDEFPPACQKGSYASDIQPADQSSPTCSGFCPAGRACFAPGIFAPSASELPPVEPGFFTFLGDPERRPCDIGTFSTGGAKGRCGRCRRQFTTLDEQATSQDQCVCVKGLYLQGEDCVACLAGADCGQTGTTLASIELQPNYWRLSNRTSDIRTCDTRPGWRPGDATTCEGGNSTCKDGMVGPLCRVCEATDHYFDSARASCNRCSYTGVWVMALPMGIVLAIAATMLVLTRFWCDRIRGEGWRDRWSARTYYLASQLELVAKAKVLVGYFQVVNTMPEVFGVSLPPEYYAVMEWMEWISLDVLAFAMRVECLGAFSERLGLTALVPLAALAAVVAGTVGVGVLQAKLLSDAPADQRPALGEAAWRSTLPTLPFVLIALFALVPSISMRIFSSFSCESFGYDDALGERRAFLLADLAVECAGLDYEGLKGFAGGLIVLWPIGVPVTFLALLLSTRNAADAWYRSLSRAVSFLHAEYRPEFFYWELLELLRKLTLTGFLLLIDQRYTTLRLTLAILLSIGHLILLLVALPYRDDSTAFVAAAASFLLICTLLTAQLIRFFDALPTARLEEFFGFDSVVPITVMILIFTLGMVVICAIVFGIQANGLRRKLVRRRLRYKSDGAEVRAPLIGPSDFHLFLSHVWATGQDQMRIVKQRLDEMVPGLRLFLDVDDMEDIGRLEGYVRLARAVLVFCSAGYVRSANCMRELRCAVAEKKQLIALLETDQQHGGVTVEEMRESLAGAGCDDLARALLQDEAIDWTRLGPMQDVTLRLIAQRLLPDRQPTYMQAELVHARAVLPPPAVKLAHHLYVSPHNAGAAELMAEMVSARGLRELKTLREDASGATLNSASSATPSIESPATRMLRSSMANLGRRFNASAKYTDWSKPVLRWTALVEELDQAESMLVYLTSKTWTSGEQSALFAAEVEAALQRGTRLLLAHEMRGSSRTHEGSRLDAVDFETLFEDDQTPRALLVGGIYSSIAVPLKGGEWRGTSMALLLQAIAKGPAGGVGSKPEAEGASSEAGALLRQLKARCWVWPCCGEADKMDEEQLMEDGKRERWSGLANARNSRNSRSPSKSAAPRVSGASGRNSGVSGRLSGIERRVTGQGLSVKELEVSQDAL